MDLNPFSNPIREVPKADGMGARLPRSPYVSTPVSSGAGQVAPDFKPQPLLQAPLQQPTGQMLPATLARVVGQVLTYFFGYKKDRTEEKEKRDRDDFAKRDILGERKVEDTHKSGLQG